MMDVHSHILPGIDDGPEDIETSIKMIRMAYNDGISQIIATPHVIPGIFNNYPEIITSRLEALNEKLETEDIPLKIYFGGEHFLDDSLCRLIKQDKLCTVNKKNKHILIEYPMNEVPGYAHEILDAVLTRGITPILAHPERNAAVLRKPDHLYSLLSKGILIQLDASSLTGKFGSCVFELAKALLRLNWVHFIASDAHSPELRPPLLREAIKAAKRIIGSKADELVHANPWKIINGEDIPVREYEKFNGFEKNRFGTRLRKLLRVN